MIARGAPVRPRRFPSRQAALTVLTAESWEDGAVGEQASADRATARAAGTRDDHEARVHALIAVEEAGHAALGRDIARWCVEAGGG